MNPLGSILRVKAHLKKWGFSLCCVLVFVLFVGNILAHHHDFSSESTYHVTCLACHGSTGTNTFISSTSTALSPLYLAPVGFIASTQSFGELQKIFLPSFPRGPPRVADGV